MKDHVRLRFAPSPTGELHLGSARTALFNYLFAKKQNGKLFLRIENTDQKRLVAGSMDRFFQDLAWLGIKFDGDPIIQSSNIKRHQQIAYALIEKGAAYYEAADKAENHGHKYADEEYREGHLVYRGQNRDLNQPPQGPYVVRLKVPSTGQINIDDAIRGRVKFDFSTIDDAVLLKSDGFPTYHLANVVDDHDMNITHVLRAEEWLPSTPKHLLIYQAMGWQIPQFAHLPLLLAPDRKKLSKRIHGTSVWVSTYRKRGFLPEALVNYLALLGWNPGDEREFFSLKELIDEFSIDRVHKAGAIFDEQKLKYFQSHYVRQLSAEALVQHFSPYISSQYDVEFLHRLTVITQDRLVELSEFPALIKPFVSLPQYPAKLLIFKKSNLADTFRGLHDAHNALAQADKDAWQSVDILNQILLQTVQVHNLQNGDVFWPVRVALTGQERSPSPAECLWALGREESLRRLKVGLKKIKS